MNGKHRSKEEWIAVLKKIEDLRASGKDAAQASESMGIAISQYYSKRKLFQSQLTSPGPSADVTQVRIHDMGADLETRGRRNSRSKVGAIFVGDVAACVQFLKEIQS